MCGHNRLSAFGVIGTDMGIVRKINAFIGHNRLSAFGVIGTTTLYSMKHIIVE